MNTWLPRLKSQTANAAGGSTSGSTFGIGVETVDVMRQGQSDRESLISFYAAGIGVMFLLFSVTGGERIAARRDGHGHARSVLSTRLGMGGLLLAKWLFIAFLGVLQLS